MVSQGIGSSFLVKIVDENSGIPFLILCCYEVCIWSEYRKELASQTDCLQTNLPRVWGRAVQGHLQSPVQGFGCAPCVGTREPWDGTGNPRTAPACKLWGGRKAAWKGREEQKSSWLAGNVVFRRNLQVLWEAQNSQMELKKVEELEVAKTTFLCGTKT